MRPVPRALGMGLPSSGLARRYRCAGRVSVSLAPRASSGIDAAQALRPWIGILPHLSGNQKVDLSAAEQESATERLHQAELQRCSAGALLHPAYRPMQNAGDLLRVDQFVRIGIV